MERNTIIMVTFIVVDDCIIDAEGICELVEWESMGFRLLGMAEDGVAGYELALAKKPDLIITDVLMPKMDGITMIGKIKEKLPDTKFIVTSCHDEFEYARKSINQGVVSYVLKPIDIEEIVKAALRVKDIQEENIKKQMIEYKMRQQISRSKKVLRESFFLNLSYNRFVEAEKFNKEAMQLDIPVDALFRVVIADLITKDESYAYVNELYAKEVFESTVLKTFNGITFLRDYKKLAAVIWNVGEEELRDATIDFISKLSDVDVTINAIIGTEASSLFEFYERFEHAYSVLSVSDSRFGSLIIEDKEEVVEIGEINLQNIMDEVKNFFKSPDKDGIGDFVKKYIGSDVVKVASKKNFAYSVISMVCILLSERGESMEMFGEEVDLWEKINSFNDNFDIVSWLTNILVYIYDYTSERKTDKYSQLIERIRDYINKNFGEKITVNVVAECVGMSSGYVNKLFKKHTGETINDYIFKVRMENARIMLDDPYAKVYEIAGRVGYEANAYFSFMFKSYYGITPSEYRNSKKIL